MVIDKSQDTGKLLLRLTLGGLVLLHGIDKITGGVTGVEALLRAAGLPPALAYGAFLGEVVGPLLLIIGWEIRVGAALVAVNMLFAIALAHAADVLRLNDSGGWAIELQAMYLFAAIAVFLIGAGRWSADQS